MANRPDQDGAFLAPPEELLQGCWYTDQNEVCPLGAPNYFEGKYLNSTGEKGDLSRKLDSWQVQFFDFETFCPWCY